MAPDMARHAQGGEPPRRVTGDTGFTLLELLIGMVILGVLAGIVVFAVGGMNRATAVAACRADYKTVETAQGAYQTQEGSPATSVGRLVGVWLREAPTTSHGYVIGIDPATGNVTVQSTNPAHAAQVGSANCAFA
jgi:prepilin-type N-terminal cleavage/methylation domain-containing protein